MINSYAQALNKNCALVFVCLSFLTGCDVYWSDERCEAMMRLLEVVDGDVEISVLEAKDFKAASSDSTLRRGDYTIVMAGIDKSNIVGYRVTDNDTPNQVLIDTASGLGTEEVVPSGLWEESAFAALNTEAAKSLSCDSNLSRDQKALIATVFATATDFWTPLAEPVDLLLSTELRVIILIERDDEDATLGRLIQEKNGELHQVFLYGDEVAPVLDSLGLTAVANQ